jgi:hypothetical protein
VNRRVEPAREPDDLAAVVGIGRHDEVARCGHAGLPQHVAARRLAVHRGDPLVAQGAHGLHVELDDRRLDAVGPQQARQGAPVGP